MPAATPAVFKPSRRPSFFLFVSLLLFVELFAPAAYAETTPTPVPSATPAVSIAPTPSPFPNAPNAPSLNNPVVTTDSNQPGASYQVGGCFLYQMTDAERRQLWDYLYRNGKPFQADWVNDFSPSKAQQNSSVPGDPLARRELAPEDSYTLPIKDLAAMIGGLKEEDVAKAMDLWDYSTSKVKKDHIVDGVAVVSAKEALKYLNAQPQSTKGKEVITQIQDQITKLTATKEQKDAAEKVNKDYQQAYGRFKITLPDSGRQMSLADFLSQHKIDPNSCLLKNTMINGKVSYAAVLDSDLTFSTGGKHVFAGDVVSPATGKPVPELESARNFTGEDIPSQIKLDPKAPAGVRRGGVNQFMTGDVAVGYLDLNGGGNIIIPEFYRDWISFVNAYTRADLYASLVTGAITVTATKNLKEAKKIHEDTSARLQKLRDGNPLSYIEVDEKLYGKIVHDSDGRMLLKDKIHHPTGDVDRFQIDNLGQIQYFNGKTPVGPPQAVNAPHGSTPLEAMLKERKVSIKREPNGVEERILQADENIKKYESAKHTLTSRVVSSYVIAGGWLGSARLLYSYNSGLLFQIRERFTDQFFRLLVSKPVLADFRKATGILAAGRIQEVLSSYVGTGFTPEKAFYPVRQLLINEPEIKAKVPPSLSLTGFNEMGGDLSVFTLWRGKSYTVNYEDLRLISKDATNQYDSLDVVAYKSFPGAVMPKKDLSALTTFFALAVPYLAARSMFDLAESALGSGIFLTTLEFLEIPDQLGRDMTCDKAVIDDLKNRFRLAFAGSIATTVIAIAIPFTTATGFWSQLWYGAVKILDWTNPADIYKWYLGDEAIAYTSNCKDSMHTILAFQKIPDVAVQQAKNPLSNIPGFNQLTSGSVLNPTDEEKKRAAELQKLTEIMNLRTVLTNQVGYFITPELLFFHIKDSTSFTHNGAYDLIKGTCEGDFRLQDKDGRGVTLTKDGARLYGPNGELIGDFHSLEWKIRAVTNTINQQIARTIIPNKIISSKLPGGDNDFLAISAEGRTTLVNPPCDLRAALRDLTGRDIGNDLTSAIGAVKAIQTDAGNIGLVDGKVYFVNNAGAAVTAPSPDDLKKAFTEGSRVSIKNSGSVVVHGGDPKDQTAGTLKSIMADNGQILYDSATGRVDVIIYTIFETSGQNLASVNLAPRGQGVQIRTVAKVGQEASAQKLNAGLDKIAGKEGITQLETKDHLIYITPDGKLRIVDKSTGQTQEYNLTGPVKQDGNSVVIPTDHGEVRLTLNNDNGRPTLSTEGAGLKELLPLLVARGQNGLMTFNPSTGAITVNNGQDIPMNPDFASKGIGFAGNQDGSSQGIPLDNPFGKGTDFGSGTNTNPPALFLPAWPTEMLPLVLMVLALLGTVVAVRFRKPDEND